VGCTSIEPIGHLVSTLISVQVVGLSQSSRE